MNIQDSVNLMLRGPIISVVVRAPKRKDWRPEYINKPEKERTGKALIDTGTLISVVSSDIIESLSLRANGFVESAIINGSEKRQTFYAGILIPELNFRIDKRVMKADIHPHYDMIIGRDIMGYWQSFVYNGKAGIFTITT